MSTTRVNNIAVTRLFSTGRYEHTKLSVSAEPGTRPPGQLMREIEEIVADLNPEPPVSDYDLERAKEVMTQPESGTGTIYDKEWAQGILTRYEDWLHRRLDAYKRLDAIGAAYTEESRETH